MYASLKWHQSCVYSWHDDDGIGDTDNVVATARHKERVRREKGFKKFRRKSNNRLIHHTWLRMCHVRSESSLFSFIRFGIATSKLCSNSLRILKLENISNVENWSSPETGAASSCTFNVNSTRAHTRIKWPMLRLWCTLFWNSKLVVRRYSRKSGRPHCGPRRTQENASEGMSQTKLFSLCKRISPSSSVWSDRCWVLSTKSKHRKMFKA